MTNLTEDRLTRAGHDVRRAIATLPDVDSPRRRRPVGALVLAGTAALVVLVAVAVPVLLQDRSEPAGPAAPPSPSPAPLGESVVVEADVELGSLRVNSLTDAGDRLVAMAIQGREPADPVVFTASADGLEWVRTAESFAADDLGPQAVSGDVHLAIGATGGADTTVYRSADQGGSWAAVEIPTPAGHAHHVAQRVFATGGGEFVAAGISTPTTFDDEYHTAVWTSVDGVLWEAELLGAHGVQPVHAAGFAEVDGRLVVFASGASPAIAFAYERQPDGGWVTTDLTPPGTTDSGEFVNLDFIGAAVVDGHLHAWWSYGVLGGGEIVPQAFAVRRPAGDGSWEAKPLSGPVPMALAVLDGELIGLAPPDPAERYTTPSGVLVVGSHAGVSWHELARYDDVWLRHLVVTEDSRVIAAGSRLGTGEPGVAVIRVLRATGSVSEMLGEEPGG